LLATRARGRAVVVAFWHDSIPLLPLMVTRLGWPGHPTVLLSWHRDAEIAARVVSRFGLTCVHGSSTRGWVGGLLALLAARARRRGGGRGGPSGPAPRGQAGRGRARTRAGPPGPRLGRGRRAGARPRGLGSHADPVAVRACGAGDGPAAPLR